MHIDCMSERSAEGIGLRIDAAAAHAGMELIELAKRLGVAKQTITAIKSGRMPGHKHLHSMAKELGVDYDWLAKNDESKRPQWLDDRPLSEAYQWVSEFDKHLNELQLSTENPDDLDRIVAEAEKAPAWIKRLGWGIIPRVQKAFRDQERLRQLAQASGERLAKFTDKVVADANRTVAVANRMVESANRTMATMADGGSTIAPAGTARAGIADVVSQIEQRRVKFPEGTDYLAIEGDSGGDVFWRGQLVILAPASVRPKGGDIAAISFATGEHAGKLMVKWISAAKHKGFTQLDSGDRSLAPLMVPDEDWLPADKRLVMGAVYRPDLLK